MESLRDVERASSGAPAAAPSFAAVCGELLPSLGRAVRLTALYGAGHPMAANAVTDAFNLLNLAFAGSRQERLTISFIESQWFCDQRLVASVAQSPEALRRFFQDSGLRSVSFTRGLPVAELAKLCAMASGVSGPTDPARLREFCARADLGGIAFGLVGAAADQGIRSGSATDPTSRTAPPSAEQSAAPARPAETASLVVWPESCPAAREAELPTIQPKLSLAASAVESATADPEPARSFGSLLKALVEFSVSDPQERIRVFTEATRLAKESADRRVQDATKALVQEKQRALGQRVRAERVIETVAEGKVIVDKDGKVLMMNPAAEELSGKRLSEVAGKHIMEGLPPGEHVVAMAQDLNPDPGPEPKVSLAADEEVGRALRRSLAVVEDDSGRVVGTYAALPDAVKYKETLRLQEEFLSRVTHDLQAPLASITCALELLNERSGEALGAEGRRFVEISLRNSQQLTDMIRDILDFSKLQSGRMAIRPTPSSVTGMVREAVEGLRPWADNKGIELSYRAPDPDLMVLADHQRIVQVLSNLIANAIKFTPRGGRIVAAAGPRPDKHGHVVCAVKDTGQGIPRQDLKRIFEKFAQASDHEDGQPGVGLGLALVSEFIKLHGGTVWAESEAGRGSTFYFTLPSRERGAGA